MALHAFIGSCAHLSYVNATVHLLEEALMESDQQVVKTAKLVVFVAVMESAYTGTTWVLEMLWNLEHGNLSSLFIYISANGSGPLWNLEVCANLSGIWRVLFEWK